MPPTVAEPEEPVDPELLALLCQAVVRRINAHLRPGELPVAAGDADVLLVAQGLSMAIRPFWRIRCETGYGRATTYWQAGRPLNVAADLTYPPWKPRG